MIAPPHTHTLACHKGISQTSKVQHFFSLLVMQIVLSFSCEQKPEFSSTFPNCKQTNQVILLAFLAGSKLGTSFHYIFTIKEILLYRDITKQILRESGITELNEDKG